MGEVYKIAVLHAFALGIMAGLAQQLPKISQSIFDGLHIGFGYWEFHFYLTAGGFVPRSDNLTFKPAFLIREENGAPANINLNTLRLFYEGLPGLIEKYTLKTLEKYDDCFFRGKAKWIEKNIQDMNSIGMRLESVVLGLFFFLAVTETLAQTGIGTQSPDENAVLDVSSTTKGVLIPRLTEVQVTALEDNSPVEGMLVYNTDQGCVQIYTGSAFECLTVDTGVDPTKDAWVDDPANNMVKLGTLSDGTTIRPAGRGFVAYDDGNVGIGTEFPFSKLSVVDATGEGAYVPIADFLAPANAIAGNNTNLKLGVASSDRNSADIRFNYQGSNSDLNRLDFGFDGIGDPRMSIRAGGNVGIGTTAPTARLNVKPASASASGLRLENISNSKNKQDANIAYTSPNNSPMYIDGNGYVYKKFNPVLEHSGATSFDGTYNITNTPQDIVSVNNGSIVRFQMYSGGFELGSNGTGLNLYAEITYGYNSGFRVVTYGYEVGGTGSNPLVITGEGTQTLTFNFDSGGDLVLSATGIGSGGSIRMNYAAAPNFTPVVMNVFQSFRSR
ncbi:hypothetical protein FKX85_00880 [Echinicola soli]|uniref:Uncharacterized protein n=1 Tax=Echinicola soli TaxID=2591634 RepID=A0A514CCX4_9BACT|nr:hypothetical protein [Echinicola soli]QDH77675.1 hypothetical protein FKX85_00880 [Echinicola soli]